MFSIKYFLVITIILVSIFTFSCHKKKDSAKFRNAIGTSLIDPQLEYTQYNPHSIDRIVSRTEYANKLYGFWLGQCIANWTGLVTEMDKIGNIGEIKTGKFYTRDDWGKLDQPSIWSDGVPSELSTTIDFVFKKEEGEKLIQPIRAI